MSHPHEQLSRYVDGELDEAEAEAVASHVAGCAACSAALHDALQLVALEAAARSSTAEQRAAVGPRRTASSSLPPASAVPAGVRRRPRWRTPAVAAAFAAAAVVAVWLIIPHGPGPTESPVAIATAQDRTIEGRVSYSPADPHRPYRVVRATGGAAARPSDAISLETLAQLERRRDFHGVAAAMILLGEPARAAGYLDRATAGPDVLADRALLQLLAGNPEDALIALDAVLATQPRHPQALWNRALALRDLGLTASAAEAFEAVALLHEPGWSDEASGRARDLTAQLRERETAFRTLARKDGPRLASAPDAVTPQTARRFPGAARVVFYDAVRGAASADAVRALAPLARELDAVYGGTTLTAYLERTARADFAVRAPLARRYAALVGGDKLESGATRTYLDALRTAHADDILIGALIRTAPANHVPADGIAELRRLCDATGDLWFHLLGIEQAMYAQLARRDHAAIEALGAPALAECQTSRLDYRCATIELVLGDSYLYRVRLTEARRLLTSAAARVRRGGEWYLERRSIERLAELELIGDDVSATTLPIARAYTRELALRDPEYCASEVWGRQLIALMLINRVDFAGARAELAQRDAVQARCKQEIEPEIRDMFLAAHVLRDPAAGSTEEVARLRAQIARAREAAPPAERAMLDQTEGRLLIDRERAPGVVLLERAIAEADELDPSDMTARKARSYAYSPLVLDAARAGEWDRVWTLLGRAARATATARCGLGAAVEDGASMVVARDAAGASHGAFAQAGTGPAIDGPRLVPTALQTALGGCPEVEVLARPPVEGLPEILPDEVAWSYRLDGDRVAPPGPAPVRPTRLVIADAEPPAALGAARLLPWRSSAPPDVRLEGAAATPSRALAELASATFIEIHSHGMADAAGADASFLMLSPEADGRYALTAAAIRQQPLRGRPIVVLAACHAATAASFRHEAWSLPAAFVAAGARAVIASTGVIDDASAGALFDDLRARIERGASPAVALRDARIAWLRSNPGATWVRSLMVFQ